MTSVMPVSTGTANTSDATGTVNTPVAVNTQQIENATAEQSDWDAPSTNADSGTSTNFYRNERLFHVDGCGGGSCVAPGDEDALNEALRGWW